MTNKYGIPDLLEKKIRDRDKKCVYYNKELIYPYSRKNQKDSATIEHLNFNGPFYWDKGLEIKDVVMCCGSCNSSRGIKKLQDWFKTNYCIKKNINKETVAKIVKNYIQRTETL
jgi:hypothetical protein